MIASTAVTKILSRNILLNNSLNVLVNIYPVAKSATSKQISLPSFSDVGLRNKRGIDCQLPNSTTRTPATDMLHNTTNGRAHNNSTTCCTCKFPNNGQKIVKSQHLDMSRCWALALLCGKLLYNI